MKKQYKLELGKITELRTEFKIKEIKKKKRISEWCIEKMLSTETSSTTNISKTLQKAVW